MQRLTILLLVIALGCNKEQFTPGKGNATFSMTTLTRSGGRLSQNTTPTFALLSIEDANGKPVFQNKKLNLFSFGQGYLSESLELLEGSYKLTQFQILDANNAVIFASPVQESDMAKYVTNPLPLNFNVANNATTQVVPEVLTAAPSDVPSNFGYVSFGFEVKNRPGVSFTLAGAPSVQRAKLEFVNGSERIVKYFNNPVASIDINSDSLLGKKWNTKATVWFVQDSCFQRVSRLKTMIDLTNSNSFVLPSLLDSVWQRSFYSEHFSYGGDSTIAFYRTIKGDNLLIEIEGPTPGFMFYYGYADEGYWDANWQPVCGMIYQEIYDQFFPSTSVTLIDTCNSLDKVFIDDLIVVDAPGFTHFEDYFAWTADGNPYCGDNTGAIVNAKSRGFKRTILKNQ